MGEYYIWWWIDGEEYVNGPYTLDDAKQEKEQMLKYSGISVRIVMVVE